MRVGPCSVYRCSAEGACFDGPINQFQYGCLCVCVCKEKEHVYVYVQKVLQYRARMIIMHCGITLQPKTVIIYGIWYNDDLMTYNDI